MRVDHLSFLACPGQPDLVPVQCLHGGAPGTNPRALPQPSIDIGSLHRIRRRPWPIHESHNKTGQSTLLGICRLSKAFGQALLCDQRFQASVSLSLSKVGWLCVREVLSPFQNGGTGYHWVDLRSGQEILRNCGFKQSVFQLSHPYLHHLRAVN